MTDENAIKHFPLIVKVNIEPLELDETLLHILVLISRYLVKLVAALVTLLLQLSVHLSSESDFVLKDQE